MLVMFEATPYLLCGVGDGSLNYYQMEMPEGTDTVAMETVSIEIGHLPIV